MLVQINGRAAIPSLCCLLSLEVRPCSITHAITDAAEALHNEKLVISCGSEEKVLTQIPLQGSKNRSNVKENKELGECDWGEKIGSSSFYYKNFGNQHSKRSYETERALCFRNMWKEKLSCRTGGV